VNSPDVIALDAAVGEERLVVTARDGYRLGATLYARTDGGAPRDAAVFNGGGGLAHARYRHFLRYVAAEGVPVLAYDYRGVGASRPKRLRGFEAGLEDWAELDHAAAIDALATRWPAARLASISHSIGALAACTSPHSHDLHQMVVIGPHTGYWKDYRAPWRWPMALGWHVAMPLIARAVGYFPGTRLHVGDDFPKRFALQWAGRTTPEFRFDHDGADEAARAQRLLESARTLSLPVLALTFYDDAFVGEAAVRRLLFAIPAARVARVDVSREDARGERIGHFGFFRRRRARLWPIVTRFLQTEV
jgi:predicted alpha/beta hydrolase